MADCMKVRLVRFAEKERKPVPTLRALVGSHGLFGAPSALARPDSRKGNSAEWPNGPLAERGCSRKAKSGPIAEKGRAVFRRFGAGAFRLRRLSAHSLSGSTPFRPRRLQARPPFGSNLTRRQPPPSRIILHQHITKLRMLHRELRRIPTRRNHFQLIRPRILKRRHDHLPGHTAPTRLRRRKCVRHFHYSTIVHAIIQHGRALRHHHRESMLCLPVFNRHDLLRARGEHAFPHRAQVVQPPVWPQI